MLIIRPIIKLILFKILCFIFPVQYLIKINKWADRILKKIEQESHEEADDPLIKLH